MPGLCRQSQLANPRWSRPHLPQARTRPQSQVAPLHWLRTHWKHLEIQINHRSTAPRMIVLGPLLARLIRGLVEICPS